MIVTLGDLTLNILAKPEVSHRRPSSGPGSVTMTGGGSAANFAVWASRLGQNVRFIGKVGTDSAAELLEIDLLKEGVLPELVAEQGSTATLVQLVDKSGQQTLMPDRGVAALLKPEDIREEWLADASWLHLPATSLYELPIAQAAAKAIRSARQAKAKVSIDLASAAALRKYGPAKFAVLLKSIRPDVLFANQDQAALFAAGVLGEIAQVAILKLGESGCSASDSTGYHEYPAEKVQVVDPLGAGDAFDAAWCVAYILTGSCDQACRRANQLAAQVIHHPGARPRIALRPRSR